MKSKVFFAALTALLFFCVNTSAFAETPVSYVNRVADESGRVTSSNETCDTYTSIDNDMGSWWTDGDWYVVDSSVTIYTRIRVSVRFTSYFATALHSRP